MQKLVRIRLYCGRLYARIHQIVSFWMVKREGVKGKRDDILHQIAVCAGRSCPTDALDYSNEYRLIGFTREEENFTTTS